MNRMRGTAQCVHFIKPAFLFCPGLINRQEKIPSMASLSRIDEVLKIPLIKKSIILCGDVVTLDSMKFKFKFRFTLLIALLTSSFW